MNSAEATLLLLYLLDGQAHWCGFKLSGKWRFHIRLIVMYLYQRNHLPWFINEISSVVSINQKV